jgi:hypothetical protein
MMIYSKTIPIFIFILSLSLMVIKTESALAQEKLHQFKLWPSCQNNLDNILTLMGVKLPPQKKSRLTPLGQSDTPEPTVTKVEFEDYDFERRGKGGFSYVIDEQGKLTLKFFFNTPQGNMLKPEKRNVFEPSRKISQKGLPIKNEFLVLSKPIESKKHYETHEFSFQNISTETNSGCEFLSYNYTPEAQKNSPLTESVDQKKFLQTCGTSELIEIMPKYPEVRKLSRQQENSPFLCSFLKPTINFDALAKTWFQVMQTKRPLPSPALNDKSRFDDLYIEKKPYRPSAQPKTKTSMEM